MKILVLADSLMPSDGPGRYASGLLEALRKGADREERREEIERIVVALPRRHEEIPETFSDAGPDRFEVLRLLPSRHLYYLRRSLFPLAVCWAALRLVPHARRADVVYAVKDYPFSLIAALAARLARRPLVVTVFGTFGVMPLASREHRERLRFVYRQARRLIFISGYTVRRLRGEIDDARTRVIMPGIDSRFLGPIDFVEESPPYLLGVGLLRERKGFEVALEAFLATSDEFSDLEYRIAGRLVEGPLLERIRARLREHPAGSRVRLLGEVGEDELLRLYDGCTLFVLTPIEDSRGRFEGLGLVYLEAGARGKAVLGSRECGAEDAVVEGETGRLSPPGDVEACADLLRRLLRDRTLRERFGRAGRARAEETTWARASSSVVEALAEAAEEGPCGSR